MSTTIKSTELDFQNIKESLKEFLKSGEEFNDFDFEGSALNNILDVLAYNTHYNALQTNFALNESFLVTAQLRPSVVSLAEGLGYVPDSKKSSVITVKLTIDATGVAGLPPTAITITPGQLSTRGTRDRIDYTYTNRTSLRADKSTGVFTFHPISSPDDPILLYEGDPQKVQFIVGNSADSIYIIPDKDIDISTAIVKVFENQGSANVENGEYSVYTNLLDASTISSGSRLYVLRESPNTFFELSFGNGTSLGLTPQAGNVIEVDYLRTNGSEPNGIASLSLTADLYLGEIAIEPDKVGISVINQASGGTPKEGIESIRKNAPFQFAAQNRMVTADDYSSLILKKYSPFIKDIQSWGGEDNPDPDYGTVFTSIVWKDNINATTLANTRQGILDLSDQFQIASFKLTFTDPVVTYISTEVFYQFNPALTGLSSSKIRETVLDTVSDYFDNNTGKFSQTFRLSNLLTEVDAADPSVLSSRANIILSRRIIPQLLTTRDYVVNFPAALRDPELSTVKTVWSSNFTYNGGSVFIRNKLDQRTVAASGEYGSQPSNVLQVVGVSTGQVVVDNIGTYDDVLGTISITGLRVQDIAGSVNFIQMFGVPANQSVINSVRNNIIEFDTVTDTSFATPIVVETR